MPHPPADASGFPRFLEGPLARKHVVWGGRKKGLATRTAVLPPFLRPPPAPEGAGGEIAGRCGPRSVHRQRMRARGGGGRGKILRLGPRAASGWRPPRKEEVRSAPPTPRPCLVAGPDTVRHSTAAHHGRVPPAAIDPTRGLAANSASLLLGGYCSCELPHRSPIAAPSPRRRPPCPPTATAPQTGRTSILQGG